MPPDYLIPLIGDSRLKHQVGFGGSIIPAIDLESSGLEYVFCSNCGKPLGGFRFDDPNETLIEVVCDACVAKLGPPPGARYAPED